MRGPLYKKCNSCNEDKPSAFFSKCKRAKDGLSYKCKTCVSKCKKKEYERNKNSYLEKAKLRYSNNKERIKEYARNRYNAKKEELIKKARGYYQKNKNLIRYKQNQYSKRMYSDLRIKAINILGSKCQICGFDDIRALQIDHVDGGGRKHRKIYSNFLKYYKLIIEDTLKNGGRYQLLCANCNTIKMFENDER